MLDADRTVLGCLLGLVLRTDVVAPEIIDWPVMVWRAGHLLAPAALADKVVDHDFRMEEPARDSILNIEMIVIVPPLIASMLMVVGGFEIRGFAEEYPS